jgi:hypothetical protein
MPSSCIWLLILALPLLQASAPSGTKITIQSGPPGNLSDRTTYTQVDRMRTEYRNSFGRRHPAEPAYGPHLARIVRCDLGQSFELNLDTSEYTSSQYPPKPLTDEQIKARGLDRMMPPGNPTIRVEIKTTDTGERKEMFGHAARHVITTRTQTPLDGSKSELQEMVTDGWYIDFDQQLSCEAKSSKVMRGYISSYLSVGNGRHPLEKPEFVKVGEPETGFLMDSTVTSKSPSLHDGTTPSFEMHVTEFAEGPLDPALFEIPAGFKLVDHIDRNPPPATLFNKP